MLSKFIFSFFLGTALIQPMAGGDQIIEVGEDLSNFGKEIEDLYKNEDPGSPFNYEQGLRLLKRINQDSQEQIRTIPVTALAKLYRVNDSFYNRELKKLSAKLPLETQKKLAQERLKGLPRGYLLSGKRVLMGGFLPRAEVPPRYQPKKLFRKPLVIFNDPFWEAVPTITQNKDFHQGEDLFTTSDHGFQDENGNPIPTDKKVGYNLYIPEKEPKALVIDLYGGAKKEYGKKAAFAPKPNHPLNSLLLSNEIAVAELNLDDLRENPDSQSVMKKGMFNQVLNGVLTFLEKITQDPQSLSKDSKAQETLEQLKGRKIFLYGGSFGGRMVLDVLKACSEKTKIKLAGVISHDGSLYMLDQAPKSQTPVLVLQNSNDGIIHLNVAVDYRKKLSEDQRFTTDFYMPRAGNLSLSPDPNQLRRDRIIYVGHFTPREEDARRREEQILDFIHRNLGEKPIANSKTLKTRVMD